MCVAGTFITDVWRIFSAAKGSSAFHNKCLWQIVQFYRGVIGLKIVIVCTDGCRGQYKGRRNFRCVSIFAAEHTAASYEPSLIPMGCSSFRSDVPPSQSDLRSIVDSVLAGAGAGANATMTDAALSRQPPQTTAPATPQRRTAPAPSPPPIYNVILRHLFACGHHFKGPHDGFGKDAKFMPKTAERHQKARIATTHDLYHFNAVNLPCPRSNIKAADVIASIQRLPQPLLAQLDKSHLPRDWAAVLEVTAPPPGTACLPCDVEPPLAANAILPPPTDLSAAAVTDDELVRLEGLELDDLNARPTVSYHEEDPDSEPEDTSAGDFNFEFDEFGSRITREKQLDDVGHVASPHSTATALSSSSATPSSTVHSSVTQPPPKAVKLTRNARLVTTTVKSAGQEDGKGGEVRTVTQQSKQPGIFTPSRYFWLYYAVYPAVGVNIVPVGTICKSELEAHAILDPVENVDADAVQHSNSTYEWGGVDASHPGLLYAKTLPCLCAVCWDPSLIR